MASAFWPADRGALRIQPLREEGGPGFATETRAGRPDLFDCPAREAVRVPSPPQPPRLHPPGDRSVVTCPRGLPRPLCLGFLPLPGLALPSLLPRRAAVLAARGLSEALRGAGAALRAGPAPRLPPKRTNEHLDTGLSQLSLERVPVFHKKARCHCHRVSLRRDFTKDPMRRGFPAVFVRRRLTPGCRMDRWC